MQLKLCIKCGQWFRCQFSPLICICFFFFIPGLFPQVCNLSSGHFYQFRVFAANLSGVGQPSEASEAFLCEKWTMPEPGKGRNVSPRLGHFFQDGWFPLESKDVTEKMSAHIQMCEVGMIGQPWWHLNESEKTPAHNLTAGIFIWSSRQTYFMPHEIVSFEYQFVLNLVFPQNKNSNPSWKTTSTTSASCIKSRSYEHTESFQTTRHVT